MMKKHFYAKLLRLIVLLPLLLTDFALQAWSQELVPNGDFENYLSCPTSTFVGRSNAYGTWTSVTDWASPLLAGSPDYMNACAKTWTAGVPVNFIGYRTAHSGNAYMGIYTCSNFRSEYIITELSRPLVKDSIYQVRFYTSPAGCGIIDGTGTTETIISVREIGAHFSDTPIYYYRVDDTGIARPYHIVSSPEKKMTDTLQWYEVSGRYTAQGGERWLTIGRFTNHPGLPAYDTIRPAMGTSNFPSVFAYNYIEDVSVMRVAKKGIPNQVAAEELSRISVSPNPPASRLHINGADAVAAPLQITITGVTGAMVKKIMLADPAHDIDVSDIPTGTYFLWIDAARTRCVFPFVKQ